MHGRRTVTSSHYDPWAHARELGLRVLWGDPGDGLLGLYDHDTRIIVLREGMSQMQSRCVLAHEIVHAEHGDMPLKDADPIWCAQREQRCDEVAAGRLIDAAAYVRAMQVFPHCLHSLARSLHVTPDIATAFAAQRRRCSS